MSQVISEEDKKRAREMDLLTYLENYEPDNLEHVCGNEYRTVEHDSLTITAGKGWYWHSRGFGGYSALDYLIKVRGMTFPKACEQILGIATIVPPVFHKSTKPEEPKVFVMPELNDTFKHVYAYLNKTRGIDGEIIKWCFERKYLFETKEHHNCLFVGYDKEGTPKHGTLRGTYGKYSGDCKGSDKSYTFSVNVSTEPEELHIFEAPIDLLSYMTLDKMQGGNWFAKTCISLSGVAGKDHVHRSLGRYLDEHPTITTLYLHLDNDEAGRLATKVITENLKDKYTIIDEPAAHGKDINDELLYHKEHNPTQEVKKKDKCNLTR